MRSRGHRRHTAIILLLACAVIAVTAAKKKKDDEVDESMIPKNIWADMPYAGCEGGYCPAVDSALEHAFYKAAAEDNVAELKALLAKPGLNISRNIVPDSDGHARVVDVGIWAATKHGGMNALKVLFDAGGRDTSEHGHLVDLAAENGNVALLQQLLDNGYTIGTSSLAYAAKYGNIDMMKALLNAKQEVDLKAAMQAASSITPPNPDILDLLVEAGAMREIRHPVTGRETVHDWRGDYAGLAIENGNVAMLRKLFEAGWKMRWQSVEGLIKAAATTGNPEVLSSLLSSPAISEDADELEEAVEAALKVGAERGHTPLVEMLVKEHPGAVKEHCQAAVVRATKYARFPTVQALETLCNTTTSSKKLQQAGWLGQVLLAAKQNHLTVLNLLLAAPDATALLGKLYSGRGAEAGAPGGGLPADMDPLVAAAKAGHKEVVEALMKHALVLCSPCAAVEAAGQGQLDIVKLLVEGPAKKLLEAEGDSVQEALRAISLALDGAHWDVVEFFVASHDSPNIAPYLLTAVVNQGKPADMRKMLDLVEKYCDTNADYVVEQIHSAMVTAGLRGELEILNMLENSPKRALKPVQTS